MLLSSLTVRFKDTPVPTSKSVMPVVLLDNAGVLGEEGLSLPNIYSDNVVDYFKTYSCLRENIASVTIPQKYDEKDHCVNSICFTAAMILVFNVGIDNLVLHSMTHSVLDRHVSKLLLSNVGDLTLDFSKSNILAFNPAHDLDWELSYRCSSGIASYLTVNFIDSVELELLSHAFGALNLLLRQTKGTAPGTVALVTFSECPAKQFDDKQFHYLHEIFKVLAANFKHIVIEIPMHTFYFHVVGGLASLIDCKKLQVRVSFDEQQHSQMRRAEHMTAAGFLVSNTVKPRAPIYMIQYMPDDPLTGASQRFLLEHSPLLYSCNLVTLDNVAIDEHVFDACVALANTMSPHRFILVIRNSVIKKAGASTTTSVFSAMHALTTNPLRIFLEATTVFENWEAALQAYTTLRYVLCNNISSSTLALTSLLCLLGSYLEKGQLADLLLEEAASGNIGSDEKAARFFRDKFKARATTTTTTRDPWSNIGFFKLGHTDIETVISETEACYKSTLNFIEKMRNDHCQTFSRDPISRRLQLQIHTVQLKSENDAMRREIEILKNKISSQASHCNSPCSCRTPPSSLRSTPTQTNSSEAELSETSSAMEAADGPAEYISFNDTSVFSYVGKPIGRLDFNSKEFDESL